MIPLRLNAWLVRLGGRHAFDGYVWTLFLIASTWVTLFIDFGRSGSHLDRWLLVGAAASLVSLGWLAGCRALWRKDERKTRRGLIVAGAYFSAGLVRNGSLTVGCLLMGLPLQNARLLISGLATLVLLSLANQTAARRIASQTIEADLLRERRKLIWLSATYDERVSQAQKSLHQQIEAEVFPSLREAVAKLDLDDTAESADLASYLTDTVNTVVRPLSERLAKNTEPIFERLDEISSENPGLSSGIRYSIRAALRPTTTVGALLLVAMVLSPALGHSGNFMGYAIASGVAFVVLTAAKLAWPKRLDALTRPTAAATIAAIYLVVFAASETLAFGNHSFSQLLLIQYSFALGGAMILTRLVLLEQTSTEARRLLAFQNDSLALLISGLRKQIWLARRNTAWVLHGPIQSALTSAAMALGSNSEQLRERKAIRDTIADALEALESKSPTQPRLEDALTDITRVWERSCKVEVELDSVADLLLQEDIDSAFCVIEIVREAVSNAVRHGRATRISARIALTQDQLIQVTVENNGVACPELQDIGLGSAMLDQITHQWTRENLPNGVRLSAFVVPESHE